MNKTTEFHIAMFFLVLIVGFIVGFILGNAAASESIARDCKMTSTFRVVNQAYSCAPLENQK